MIALLIATDMPVRRFAQGDSGDYFAVQNWMLKRGYDLMCASLVYTVKNRTTGAKQKFKGWANVVRYVDGLRVAEGLEPLVRRT